MKDAFRLAIGTLTALPVSAPTEVDRGVARRAMLIAPVTALPLAAVWLLGHVALRFTSVPMLVIGVLVVACTALYSRGLHIDGLADTVDGLSASHDRERALAVMKTGDIGPSGAAALFLVLLVQAVALGSLLTSTAGTLLAVLALLGSRQALAWGCWSRVPVARPTGLGAGVGGVVPTRALMAAGSVAVVVAAVASRLVGLSWYAGPLTVVVGVLGADYVLLTAIRRLGGMTGDVLGACVEVSLAAALVVATVVR